MQRPGIHDLQRPSDEAIGAPPAPTAIRSGARTSPLRIPLKRADLKRLEVILVSLRIKARHGC